MEVDLASPWWTGSEIVTNVSGPSNDALSKNFSQLNVPSCPVSRSCHFIIEKTPDNSIVIAREKEMRGGINGDEGNLTCVDKHTIYR